MKISNFKLKISFRSWLIVFILAIAFFLRIYRLNELMPFIGDFAWFYLSSRDMLLTGSIPLVGITSSQTWLHQGPLWTYMLGGVLWLFKFNPISGAYLTVLLGILTVYFTYKLGRQMFTERVGIIASLLYATSPLVIIHARMPYHTSPIPLFILLFVFSLYKWIKGNSNYFPLTIFFLGLLYNFELATVVLWFVLPPLFLYGKQIFTRKIILFSILAFFIPMLPVVLYDMNHGFLQTAKFANWVIYHRIIKFFFQFNLQNTSSGVTAMMPFLAEHYKRLIFLESGIIALLIFIASFGWFAGICFKPLMKRHSGKRGTSASRISNHSERFWTSQNDSFRVNYLVLFLCIFIPLVGFIFNQTPSEAYMPIFFPTVIFLTALFLDKLMQSKLLFVPTVLLLIVVCSLNAYKAVSENYLMGKPHGYGTPISELLKVSKEIIKESNGKNYNLVSASKEMQLENFEYVTWWLGHPPSKHDQPLKVVLIPNIDSIHVDKKVYNENR